MDKKTVAIASDHAGYELKSELVNSLGKQGYKVIDLGTKSGTESVNYADYGFKLAKYMKDHPDVEGIGICGTGLGISYALNRFSFIRAARITSNEDAKLAKLHNNANVIVFGGRQTSPEEALEMFKIWHNTDFEGGRHELRLHTLETKGSQD
ncbi:RpiB/LacA/LacB family sugar-phosphate isomerase [Mycoplasma sp. 128]|uniref:RpiB/LacA/LacB family sugar-phosphate isomerase n=1 Tax=Mycoplasma sp. 3341 TaxID=3447506 RepID=UPI003F655621